MVAERARLAVPLLLGLLAANSSLAQTPYVSPPEWDFVAFEVLSWGKPVHRWMIATNRGGSWIEAAENDGPAAGTDKVRWYAIVPGAANYVALEEILRELPKVAPDFNDCANYMPDLPYGTLRLSRGATTLEVAWNSGCMDRDYQEFMSTLKAADELVKSLRSSQSELRSN